jgi:hypothetical protein
MIETAGVLLPRRLLHTHFLPDLALLVSQLSALIFHKNGADICLRHHIGHILSTFINVYLAMSLLNYVFYIGRRL